MSEPNPAPTPGLEIVGVDVELIDGGYMLTCKASGDTAIATTREQAEIEGVVMRVVDSWRNPYKRHPSDDPT